MGGSRSSSASSSSTTTNTQTFDERVVAQDEAIVARDGSTVNVQRLDGQVVSAALDAQRQANAAAQATAQKVTGDALGFGEKVVQEGFQFADDALDANKQVTADAFGFGRESLNLTEEITGKAIDEFQVLSERAVDQSTKLADASNRTALEAMDKALFASKSESAQATEQSLSVVKTGITVAGIAIAAYVISKAKK